MICRALAMLIAGASLVISCDCVAANVQTTKKRADVVFRGRISAFRNADDGQRMVVFRVERSWKGDVGLVFEMAALEGVNCLSFPPGLLELGNEVLVYARKMKGLQGYFYR